MTKSKTKETVVETTLSETQIEFNDMFTNAYNHRQSSCFWDMNTGGGDSTSTGSTGTGGNWNDRWDLQDKFAIMWFGNLDQSEGYRSNVKSPEIAGRLQSTMHKLSKVDIQFVVKPKPTYGTNEDAEFMAKIAQIVIDNAFRKNKYKFRLNDAFYDALRHGSAPVTIDFIYRSRPVQIAISEEHYTKEEKAALEKSKTLAYRKITKIDQRDVVIANRRIQEIYWDASARNVHSDLYYAGFYFSETWMSKSRFKKIYGSKPGYKNVDSVKGMSELNDTDLSFFTPPKDMQKDSVRIIEGWNYDEDSFMVRANDKFIYEGPMPYNHKKLNIVQFSPFKLPEQLYGIGLIDLLIPIVSQIEMFTNSINDYVMYSSNPVLMVEKNSYGEFSKHYKRARPGMMIPVMDVNRAVAPLKYLPLSMDVFQALNNLNKDAVIASQQDPSQLGVVQKNATATANLINKEVMDAYVNFVLINFTETLNQIGEQVWSLQKQFLAKKDIYEVVNGGEVQEQKTFRRIRIDDQKVDIDWEKKTVTITEDPGGYSYIEMNPKMQAYSDDDLQIEVAGETLEVISKALKIQQSKENFAQFAPYMVDPNDKAKVAMHPTPWINGPSMLEEQFDLRGINKKHLLKRSIEQKKDIETAMQQNKEMYNYPNTHESPLPEAGMSDVHIRTHEDFLAVLTQQKQKLDHSLETMVQTAMGKVNAMGHEDLPIDPSTGQPNVPMPTMPPEAKKLFDKKQKLEEIISTVEEHLTIDSMPAYQRTDALLMANKPPAAPPMPQGMGAGEGGMGGNTPMGGMGNAGGGNAPATNMVADNGMQGGPGAVMA